MATVKILECWINRVFLKKFSCSYCKKKRDVSGRATSSVVNDAVDKINMKVNFAIDELLLRETIFAFNFNRSIYIHKFQN